MTGPLDPLRAVLAQRLEELQRARVALELSFRRVGSPEMIDVLSRSEDGLVEIEAFTSRFARLTDVLIQQVLRSVDEAVDGVAQLRLVATDKQRSNP